MQTNCTVTRPLENYLAPRPGIDLETLWQIEEGTLDSGDMYGFSETRQGGSNNVLFLKLIGGLWAMAPIRLDKEGNQNEDAAEMPCTARGSPSLMPVLLLGSMW